MLAQTDDRREGSVWTVISTEGFPWEIYEDDTDNCQMFLVLETHAS